MKFKALLISVALSFSIHASANCAGAQSSLSSAYSNLASAMNSGNTSAIRNAELQVSTATMLVMQQCHQF